MATKAPRKQSKYVTQTIEILRENIPKPNNLEILELIPEEIPAFSPIRRKNIGNEYLVKMAFTSDIVIKYY